MIRTMVLLGCFFALGAQALYSFPFHLPAFPPGKAAPTEGAHFLPPPFEGKYFRLTGLTGSVTISITGHAVLGDTTIVTDASDDEDIDSSNYVHFQDGTSFTYDSTGEMIDSAGYSWNEADSSVTISDEDTSMTFYYTGTPEGMSLAFPDSTWTQTEDDGLGGTYDMTVTMENYAVIFTEISEPNPISLPGNLRTDRIKVQYYHGGIRFTWERLAGPSRLLVTDVGGRVVVEEKIRPGQKEMNISLPGSGIFTYRVVGKFEVLTQGRVYHRTK